MTANETIDANAYTPADDLVVPAAYDPLGGDDLEVDAKGIDQSAKGVSDDERAAAPDEEDVLPYLGDPDADHAPKVVVDERPAAVRTAELFDRMKTRRKVLLGAIGACLEPAEVAAVHAKVDELQADQRSVFDGPALCALLERAGAIEQVRGEEQQPRTVVVDGVECLEPAAEVAVRYVATDAGRAMLEADKPADRLHEVLERDAVYKPIYLRILKACGEEGGKSAKELGELVDHDPLVQDPRFWAAHFFNILSECDALTWNKAWTTTELGWKAVEELELEGVNA